VWYRPMVARRVDEEYRAATPLELFFDLCFVVAVAIASADLHHDLAENHDIGPAVIRFLMVFFAIWWAWMNFTWFASAYDIDDGLYRVTTLVQMAGVLILAAGIPRAFDDGDLTVITYGYVVMRLAMVTQWLRAAASDPARRATALRFVIGITVVQVGWLLRLLPPDGWLLGSFLLLAAAELLVPVWAERAEHTTWHPRHIGERYGLFTMIVLGESILSTSLAIQSALAVGHRGVALLTLAGAGLLVVFSMWWLYFDRPEKELPQSSVRHSFEWGYGHYFVFASAAAVGAGLAVAVDDDAGIAHLSQRAVGYSVAIPVAVYLSGVWWLQVRPYQPPRYRMAYLVAVPLILLAPLGPAPVHVIAVLMVALVATTGSASRPVGG